MPATWVVPMTETVCSIPSVTRNVGQLANCVNKFVTATNAVDKGHGAEAVQATFDFSMSMLDLPDVKQEIRARGDSLAQFDTASAASLCMILAMHDFVKMGGHVQFIDAEDWEGENE